MSSLRATEQHVLRSCRVVDIVDHKFAHLVDNHGRHVWIGTVSAWVVVFDCSFSCFRCVKEGHVTVVVPRASSVYGVYGGIGVCADAKFAESEFEKFFDPISL